MFLIWYWNARPKWSIVLASPNFICHFYMRAIPKGLTFGLCLHVLYFKCNVHVFKSPEVTLCGRWGYKPSINKQLNQPGPVGWWNCTPLWHALSITLSFCVLQLTASVPKMSRCFSSRMQGRRMAAAFIKTRFYLCFKLPVLVLILQVIVLVCVHVCVSVFIIII